jgi:hypothetical protein
MDNQVIPNLPAEQSRPKHAGGRPTKLTPELIDKAQGYIATCIDTPVWTDKGGVAYVNVNLPSKVGLALYLGVDKVTIDNWCNDRWTDTTEDTKFEVIEQKIILRAEFFSIVNQVLAEQEKRLISNGLGGLYKEKTTGMLLSKHGYAEKTETDITSKGEQITSTVLPEVIAEADRILKEKKLNG